MPFKARGPVIMTNLELHTFVLRETNFNMVIFVYGKTVFLR